MMKWTIGLAALAVAGCAGSRPQTADGPAGAREPLPGCDAQAAAAVLIGRTRSATVEAQALERSGARSIRWIAPGEAVTMDYQAERLNVELDAGGRVIRTRCG